MENLVQFFVNFLIWCVAFTAYVLATLLPIVVITGNRTVAGGDLIDGQVVGVMGTYVFRPYLSIIRFLPAHASYPLVQSSSFSFPPHSSLPTFTCLCTTLRR